jgi:dihydrolipoamide dehydrogenase
MERMRASVKKSHDRIEQALAKTGDFDFYPGTARFVQDYTLEVLPFPGPEGNAETTKPKQIKGKTLFIVTGARPSIPPLKGIEKTPYLTNETALQLRELPESMIIIGGGYIAVEFAHFFEAMGCAVTIIQRNARLVPEEEPEIADLLQKSLSRRMKVLTGTEAVEASNGKEGVTVWARERGKKSFSLTARSLLLAAGRRSNADVLQVGKTGVKTNENGYIAVDEYFETSQKNIWAFGDAIGKKMFRHAANHEAELAWHNSVHGKKSPMNYLTVPHAVFTRPEIASVGLTEREAARIAGKQEILVGKAMYTDVARGEAMRETEGFAKAIVLRKNGKILGYHIIGPQASVLIQEVVNAMAGGGNLWSLAKGLHIHPALSEVVLKAFGKLREPG